MDQKNLIVFVLVFLVLGFRLYQKYGKKNSGKTGNKHSHETSFFSKDDDYEPYSKK